MGRRIKPEEEVAKEQDSYRQRLQRNVDIVQCKLNALRVALHQVQGILEHLASKRLPLGKGMSAWDLSGNHDEVLGEMTVDELRAQSIRQSRMRSFPDWQRERSQKYQCLWEKTTKEQTRLITMIHDFEVKLRHALRQLEVETGEEDGLVEPSCNALQQALIELRDNYLALDKCVPIMEGEKTYPDTLTEAIFETGDFNRKITPLLKMAIAKAGDNTSCRCTDEFINEDESDEDEHDEDESDEYSVGTYYDCTAHHNRRNPESVKALEASGEYELLYSMYSLETMVDQANIIVSAASDMFQQKMLPLLVERAKPTAIAALEAVQTAKNHLLQVYSETTGAPVTPI